LCITDSNNKQEGQLNKSLHVIKEIIIDAHDDSVWDALINLVKIKQYFMGINVESDWQAGSPIRFYGGIRGTVI
jgi:uncharacterized protein YndB with AHSA1/START domain